MRGTLIARSTEQIASAQQRLRTFVQMISEANHCEAEVTFVGESYPATINDAPLCEMVGEVWAEASGDESVVESPPVMVGEDFSYFAEEVPAGFIGLGMRNEELGSAFSMHYPKFKVDEAGFPLGAALHFSLAFGSINQLKA